MVEVVRKQLRDKPVATLEEIVELLNREQGPVIDEVRTRLNELIAALNPGNVVGAAGAVVAYLEVTVNNSRYSIPLHIKL